MNSRVPGVSGGISVVSYRSYGFANADFARLAFRRMTTSTRPTIAMPQIHGPPGRESNMPPVCPAWLDGTG
jgi:hypothetical protein